MAMSSRSILVYSLGVTLLLATVASAYSQGLKWAIVNFKVRHDFPTVRRIDSQHLSQWLSDPHRAQPILLDVRTQEEYDVSHLHDAQRVEPGSRRNVHHHSARKTNRNLLLGRLSLRRLRKSATGGWIQKCAESHRLHLRLGEQGISNRATRPRRSESSPI